MTRLAGYLKPFVFGVIMAVVLLFAQALCDLNLPNYMSRIVNIGIQQQGVEESAPEAISEEGYAFITTFMSEQDRALLEESYTAVSGTIKTGSGATRRSTPRLHQNDLCFGRGRSKETADRLDHAFGVAAWTMINVMKLLGEQQEGG